MAKTRHINTNFWSDGWIDSLDPIEKLLFLYLLTNEHNNIAGVYELPVKIMAVETGIEKEMILKILSRFENDKKIYRIDTVLVIKNFLKYQNTRSLMVKKGVENELSKVNSKILLKLKELDTLLIPYIDRIIYSNSNLDSNLDSNSPSAAPVSVAVDNLENFELEKEIEKMQNDKQEHIRIIGLYLEAKRYKPKNKDQLNSFIKRNARPACNIKGYSFEELAKTMRALMNTDIRWTLETVGKFVDNPQEVNLIKRKL